MITSEPWFFNKKLEFILFKTFLSGTERGAIDDVVGVDGRGEGGGADRRRDGRGARQGGGGLIPLPTSFPMNQLSS